MGHFSLLNRERNLVIAQTYTSNHQIKEPLKCWSNLVLSGQQIVKAHMVKMERIMFGSFIVVEHS